MPPSIVNYRIKLGTTLAMYSTKVKDKEIGFIIGYVLKYTRSLLWLRNPCPKERSVLR